ncbi:hypothetical protein [Thermus caldifontis]|uniref:hypothetical protein n=1 Tax=Thermus caldifontis TaxID=1930763 RepID=UPI0013B3A63B|nr:hypothetical protein [Thermus caldifontis]
MWKVYREVARDRLGVGMPEDADVQKFYRETDARSAFRRAVNALLEEGFHISPEVVPGDMEGVVDWVGLESGDAVALIVLSRVEEDL